MLFKCARKVKPKTGKLLGDDEDEEKKQAEQQKKNKMIAKEEKNNSNKIIKIHKVTIYICIIRSHITSICIPFPKKSVTILWP